LRLRLKLFLEVCEAVQFAHQNFVVHREHSRSSRRYAAPAGLWHRQAALAFVCRRGQRTDARGLPILYAAVRQSGAGAWQTGDGGLGHLLARRSFVSAADRETAL
jgi:hypothetical protein